MEHAGGYVRLFRKMLQNPIWTQLAPAVAKVAVYFLLRANYKPSQWYDGSKQVEIPAGSFITSYARTAEMCNLSVQQARDAFFHLGRTHFATYTRTQRWTLVSIVKWAAYQASDDEVEHAEEHATDRAKNTPENRQGTTDKELRIKNTPPSPSKTEGDGADAPLVLVSPDGVSKEKPQKPAPARKPYAETLKRVAQCIHEGHPTAFDRRDLGIEGVEKKLEAILRYRRTPVADCPGYLERIGRNHMGACESEKWSKNGGEFAPGLRNWLAPREGRYDVAPSERRSTIREIA